MKPYFLQNEDGALQVVLDAERCIFEFYASVFASPDTTSVCKKVADYLKTHLPSDNHSLVFTFRIPWVTESILQKIRSFCVDLFSMYSETVIRWYYHAEHHTSTELE